MRAISKELIEMRVTLSKSFVTILVFALMFTLVLAPCAYAVEPSETTTTTVTDLGDGLTVTSTVTIIDPLTRDSSRRVVNKNDYDLNGTWIGTVTLTTVFTYNGITAGVTSATYSQSLASGWSYTNHNLTTTTVSSSSGGKATLTANLRKNIIANVPVNMFTHCAPDGTITTD